jgi:hypothetical protein
MTFSQAKREFDIRYYHWGIVEFEKEIVDGFPVLQSFKAGSAWPVHQFMLRLPRDQQLILARALLKRSHPNAVNTLGERTLPEEVAILARCDAQASNIISFGDELRAKIKTGESPNLATKGKIRKNISNAFFDTFGKGGFDLVSKDEDDEGLRFKVRFAGWIIGTSFWFGRRTAVLDYCNNIESEDVFPFRGGIVGMGLAGGTSFNSCLGVSRSQWSYITEADIKSTCEIALGLCARFFGVLPKLLIGLEYEKVTFDGVDIRGF